MPCPECTLPTDDDTPWPRILHYCLKIRDWTIHEVVEDKVTVNDLSAVAFHARRTRGLAGWVAGQILAACQGVTMPETDDEEMAAAGQLVQLARLVSELDRRRGLAQLVDPEPENVADFVTRAARQLRSGSTAVIGIVAIPKD